MRSPLLHFVYKNDVKIVFTDLFDTLLHRTKHPNYCLKLWAKFLIREWGLHITTIDLFKIRQESLAYLSKTMNCNRLAVPYGQLQLEIFNRLKNSDILSGQIDLSSFANYFELADYHAEVGLHEVNESLRSQLTALSEKGIRIFLLTDFNLSKSIVEKILGFHGMAELFENVYVSSAIQKSKAVGDMYPYIMEANHLNADDIVMVGDNKRSDILNAAKYGIGGVHIPNSYIKLKNKVQLFGSEQKDFNKTCDRVVKKCRNSDFVFSEYLIHYHFFVSRIYDHAKKHKINDLFFLAREGLFLKNIFDDYQELHALSNDAKIQTHYLKISRQASVQISLKPLEQEDFKVLKKNNQALSLNQFLDNFNTPIILREQIADQMQCDLDERTPVFFESEVLSQLRKNATFTAFYKKNRMDQKMAFATYLSSFNANIETSGMTLVDIGWGGTMQESLYKYFNCEIPVTGLYLGLKEIYNIVYGTKRYGLNFSIYPSKSFDDHILLANGQLYEQLAAAPHGCTIAYSNDLKNPTIEFHEEQEKYVYENHVGEIQAFMRKQAGELSHNLKYTDYTKEMSQEYMVQLALKTGFFMNRSKLKFIRQISKGFFQNIGDNKVGLTYKSGALPFSKKTMTVKLLLQPEKLFRYFVKLKPRLYEKGLYPLTFMVNPFYYYIKGHRYLKKRLFSKNLL